MHWIFQRTQGSSRGATAASRGDWTHGCKGNVEEPRLAVGHSLEDVPSAGECRGGGFRGLPPVRHSTCVLSSVDVCACRALLIWKPLWDLHLHSAAATSVATARRSWVSSWPPLPRGQAELGHRGGGSTQVAHRDHRPSRGVAWAS